MIQTEKQYIDDIHNYTLLLQRLVSQFKSKEEFSKHLELDFAARHCIVVIGEAAHALWELNGSNGNPNNPYTGYPFQDITDIRNDFAHDYFAMSSETTWETARTIVSAVLNETYGLYS